MRVWRFSRTKDAHSAFSGEGARLFEARWNLAGLPMVYTSSSLALAAIEYFVHLDPSEAPIALVALAADVPDSLAIERIEVAQLPRDWRRTENSHLQRLGDQWLKSLRSAALIVPSAVVQGEWNVLLNPAHTDFTKIEIGEATPFQFDERMFKQPSK
jgi:RES domain-containing protein